MRARRPTSSDPRVVEYWKLLNRGIYDDNPEGQFARVDSLLDLDTLTPQDRAWLNRHKRKLREGKPLYPTPGRPPTPQGLLRRLDKLIKKASKFEPRTLDDLEY